MGLRPMRQYRKAIASLEAFLAAVWLLALAPVPALAQAVTPPAGTAALVCAYNTSPPTVNDKNFVLVQCDVNGKIITSGGSGGGVSSLSTACPVSGPSTGPVLIALPPGRTVSGSTDTLAAADCGGVFQYSNTTSTAVTLTAAATLYAALGNTQWCANVTVDSGAGPVTITSSGGNFNTTGSTTLTLTAKTGVTICTNTTGTGFNVGAGTPPFQPISGYKSSNWYRSQAASAVTASTAPNTISSVYCHPYIVSAQGMTAKAIGIAISTTAVGNVSMAVYKGDGVGGRPGTLIDTISAAQSTNSNPASAALTNGTDAIPSGMNWVCASFDNSSVRYLSPNANGANAYAAYTGASTINGATAVISSSTAVNGVSCTAASSCGAGFAAWSGTTFNWASFGSITWTENASSTMPEIVLQAN